MSAPPLDLNGLSPVSEASDTPTSASPARGRETRTALLQKLRPPPLVHAWDFWHEKPQLSNSPLKPATNSNIQSSTASTQGKIPAATPAPYDPRLSLLHSITDVRDFWKLFNNFSFTSLGPRTSVHLFHKSVLPLWEHPRNVHGGAWTFRRPRDGASAFFRALALLAIGEQLQEALAVDPAKLTFRDDICGISYVVKNDRFTAVQVWNRDAGNDVGVKRVLECVLAGVPEECRPREGEYYYKRHKDHAGFSPDGRKEVAGLAESVAPGKEEADKEEQKVRKMLQQVKLGDADPDAEQKSASVDPGDDGAKDAE